MVRQDVRTIDLARLERAQSLPNTWGRQVRRLGHSVSDLRLISDGCKLSRCK